MAVEKPLDAEVCNTTVLWMNPLAVAEDPPVETARPE